MRGDHQKQDWEFKALLGRMERYRGHFVLSMFSILCGTIAYLFVHCGQEKASLNAEIQALRVEVVACKDSSMAHIERAKNEHIRTLQEISQRQQRIEQETRKMRKKIEEF